WRYVYPPPFAILMVPFAQMPLALGAFIWYVLTVIAIGASVVMSASVLGMSALKQKPYLLYGLPLLSLCVLLVSGAMRCQASAFMFCGMIAAFYFHLKEKPIAAGLSLAAAALIKVFPIVLVVYFIIRRQWRALLATAVGLVLMGIILPSLYWGWQFNLDQILRWLDVVGHPAVMHNTARAQMTSLYSQLLDTTKPRNQSLESLFLSFNMPTYLTHYAVAGCALLMLGIMWHRAIFIRQPQATGDSSNSPKKIMLGESLLCSAFIIWSLLITPISESHYYGALLLPLTVLIGFVTQSGYSRTVQLKLMALGGGIMSMVMILITIDVFAVWRPLCIVSILLWLLCIRLISKIQ
ncbi:MAG: DUF2029 domain-containing protein, partial [Gammaproteobacteria bacterium]|nr:DUF2029 domain-containing protein [Gammaproteobacteria bacterium]